MLRSQVEANALSCYALALEVTNRGQRELEAAALVLAAERLAVAAVFLVAARAV